MPPRPKPLSDKFADNTRPDGDCIVWLGKCDRKGYGLVSLSHQKWTFAHRAAWYLEYGEWPDGVILHACDNPKCVNIKHLSVGTLADNIQDAIQKGRLDNRGSKHGRSKLSEEDVLAIRQMYETGELSQRAIGEKFGVKQPMVSDICRGKNWRHI